MKLKTLIIFTLGILLTACVGMTPRYSQNSPEGIECNYESKKGAAAVQATGRSGLNLDQMYKEIELFNLCMDSKLANSPSRQNNNSLNASISAIDERQKQNCQRLEFKEYYDKTACLAPNITMDQMVDPSKITPSQKVALLKARAVADEATKEVLKIIRENGSASGARTANITESTSIPQHDKNALDLYNEIKTWGEYNQKRKEIYTETTNIIRNNKN
jgi:hypothetical protein